MGEIVSLSESRKEDRNAKVTFWQTLIWLKLICVSTIKADVRCYRGRTNKSSSRTLAALAGEGPATPIPILRTAPAYPLYGLFPCTQIT